MDDLVIRDAIITDLISIQKLSCKLFELEFDRYDKDLNVDWPWSDEGKSYFENLIVRQKVLVAELNAEIVAYLAGSVHHESSYIYGDFAELENMYVLGQYRKMNIGSKLLNNFKLYCKNNGLKSIKVVASSGNNAAINFYQKNLFEVKDITLLCNL